MEDSTGDGLSDRFESVGEGVKRFGVGKLVLLLIILVAALWFFVLAPKPGSLSVRVMEIDSEQALEGVQVDVTLPDGTRRSKFTDDAGSALFLEVPTLTDLSVRVVPPSTHGSSSQSVNLASGASDSLRFSLGRNVDLQLESDVTAFSLGAGCFTNIDVSARNNGAQAADVSFVGDGKLSGLVSSDTVFLSGGQSQVLSVKVTAPQEEGKASGGLRVKFTHTNVPLSLDVTGPDQLGVSPNRLSERPGPGEQLKKLFTITNDGKSGEVRDLKAEVTGELSAYVQPLSFSSLEPLKSREQTILTMFVDVPNLPGQKIVGVLLLSSACSRISIPIELEIRELS